MKPRGPFVGALLVTMTLICAAAPAGAAPGTAHAVAQTADPARGEGPFPRVAHGLASSGPQPLLIVLDLSGSMNEDDGTGTVKLLGAKESLSQLMQLQPSGAEIGLWTYPKRGTDCEPGGYVPGLSVGPVAAPGQIAATIRGLTADGGTPTGPALRAAVDSLKATGRTSATIVLVSDGESNCGQPPCEEAKKIVAEGFDITVHAVGFRTSTAGRQELECIAGSTEGQYYSIDDSAGLGEKLKEIAVPQLELAVDASASVSAGMPATIHVVVRNPSATDTVNVTVAAAFTDTGSRSLFPAVVPPRFRVGNVPAGEQVERTWTISPAAAGQGGIAAYRVTAWGNNAPAASVEGKIQVSGDELGLGQAGPLLTAVDQIDGRIAILGDSYSSGEGARDYLTASTIPPNTCHQSMRTYAAPLYGDDRVRLIACSGATMSAIDGPQMDRGVTRSQIDQLRDGPAPEVVLMTIGGNDIHFADLVEGCVMPTNCVPDGEALKKHNETITAQRDRLSRTYQAVWRAANSVDMLEERSGRPAPILVLGYPRVLPDARTGSCSGFNAAEIQFGNDTVDLLDETIRLATDDAKTAGADVRYVDYVQMSIPAGNSACSADPYINSVDLLGGLEALAADTLTGSQEKQQLMHPNSKGYRAITNALVAWSVNAPGTTAPVEPPEAPPTIAASDPTVAIELSGSGGTNVDTVHSGDGVDVTVRGLKPGSVVTVTVRSSPQAVASLRADQDGVAHTVVYVPLDVPVGQHHLVGSGHDRDGNDVEYVQEISVAPPTPSWWWPIVALALISMVGALGAAGVARRQRRVSPADKEVR